MTKKVGTNIDVIRWWIDGPAHVSNYKETIFSTHPGRYLYSYGSHYLLAVHGGDTIFLNANKSSPTTNQHRSLVRRTVRADQTLIEVPDLTGEPADLIVVLMTGGYTAHAERVYTKALVDALHEGNEPYARWLESRMREFA